MNSVQFHCPYCSQPFRIDPTGEVGSSVRCPHCRGVVRITESRGRSAPADAQRGDPCPAERTDSLTAAKRVEELYLYPPGYGPSPTSLADSAIGHPEQMQSDAVHRGAAASDRTAGINVDALLPPLAATSTTHSHATGRSPSLLDTHSASQDGSPWTEPGSVASEVVRFSSGVEGSTHPAPCLAADPKSRQRLWKNLVMWFVCTLILVVAALFLANLGGT